ncbi:hypothetical protein ACFVGY_17035 [Streptomyces sp. NPDC127106]|uniref:hypothetical protein n=1 Tax=Streptomyces sp. NPDC127106 TaxID=3345360 RepID=UPI00363D11D0
MPVKALTAAGVCLALLGAAVAWLLLGRETSPRCNGLAENASVQKSMGAAIQPGMSCAALGEAIVKATSGGEPGRHTQAQAQVMKDVLFALGRVQPKNVDLDPALRVPLATALADYGPDLHEMLAGFDSEYVLKAGHDTPPWETGGTYHLSVYDSMFRKTLRAVAEDPRAYAVLRMAETHTTAERLAAVPADTTGRQLSLQPTRNARALGILDGIADAAAGQDAQQARKWHDTVFGRLLNEQGPARAYPDDPAGHLTAAWLQQLKNTPDEERPERMRGQGHDMARAWAQARNMDERVRQGLLAEVERSEMLAYREMKP